MDVIELSYLAGVVGVVNIKFRQKEQAKFVLRIHVETFQRREDVAANPLAHSGRRNASLCLFSPVQPLRQKYQDIFRTRGRVPQLLQVACPRRQPHR